MRIRLAISLFHLIDMVERRRCLATLVEDKDEDEKEKEELMEDEKEKKELMETPLWSR